MALSALMINLLGVQDPTGENLKVVWAEFSTLSYSVMVSII
jgi:hypothetical protein